MHLLNMFLLFQKRLLTKMDVGHLPQNVNTCDHSALLAKLHINNPRNSDENTPSKAVNFKTNPDGEKKREKYLTAKYGAHQMALIRKRLKVEMWMFDQLQELCESEVRKVEVKNVSNLISFQTESANEIDIDLDEVLDIEDENKRKEFIRVRINLIFCQINPFFQGYSDWNKVIQRDYKCRLLINNFINNFSTFQKFVDELLERAKTL